LENLLLILTVFVLAIFVGFEVITKVPAILHTPLMSGANAMSGIILIGALATASNPELNLISNILAASAIALATINVVGGFSVTHRMLYMFKKKK
jgi:NAD(P) transhydrogenase subunit alpha|tara:strand:+ start:1490 stop:1774 length:285 start_codon:yes stop_codon:yes gene_type:complete